MRNAFRVLAGVTLAVAMSAMKSQLFALLLFSQLLAGPALLAQFQPEPFSLRVTLGYTDPEPVAWSGSVTADQATIASLEGWLFLVPDSISFNTFEISAGGPVNKGLTIRGTASPGGHISVRTDRGSFSIPVFNLKLGNPVSLLDGSALAERLPETVKLTDDSREDDYPAIAVAKDSTAWAVWQSYGDQFDVVRLAKYQGQWANLHGRSGSVRGCVAPAGRHRPREETHSGLVSAAQRELRSLCPHPGSGTENMVENVSTDVPPEL